MVQVQVVASEDQRSRLRGQPLLGSSQLLPSMGPGARSVTVQLSRSSEIPICINPMNKLLSRLNEMPRLLNPGLGHSQHSCRADPGKNSFFLACKVLTVHLQAPAWRPPPVNTTVVTEEMRPKGEWSVSAQVLTRFYNDTILRTHLFSQSCGSQQGVILPPPRVP